MIIRSLLLALTLGACVPGAEASRRFADAGYLTYTAERPLLAGAREFGVSFWFKRAAVLGGKAVVLDAADGHGEGFRLVVDVRRIRLTYQAGSQRIEAFTSDLVHERWYHVAAEVRLPDGGPATAQMYLDGALVDRTREGPLAAPAGVRSIFLGGNPIPSALGAHGTVHDVCIVDRAWREEELQAMGRWCGSIRPCRPSGEVVQGPVFSASLRHEPAVDEVSGRPLRPVGERVPRGIGPPLVYGDQRPTVLVIGDTQNLDSTGACHFPCPCSRPCNDRRKPNPNCPEELVVAIDDNTKLGQFVVDYRETLDIRAVFHVGDWTVSARPYFDQLCRARALADKLNEAGVPWSCTLGNHDYERYVKGAPATRRLAHWSRPGQMPPSLFKSKPWHLATLLDDPDHCNLGVFPGGRVQEDGDYAHAFLFDLGDGDERAMQLGIVLPLGMTTAGLEWVKCRAARHQERYPNGRVWFVTHSFLQPLRPGMARSQFRHDQSYFPESGGGSVAPRAAWTDHLQHVPNLGFVFCGHHYSGKKHTARHALERPEGAPDGDPVIQMLVNGQQARGGGRGFMQILTLSVEGDALTAVEVESYLPMRDEYYLPAADVRASADDHDFTIALGAGVRRPPEGAESRDPGPAPRSRVTSAREPAARPVARPPVPAPVSADLDGDGCVDARDLARLLEAWGRRGTGQPEDLDGNAVVDAADVVELLRRWG